jgi:hypothetical protein
MGKIAGFFFSLEGHWRLQRSIPATGKMSAATMNGTASFAKAGDNALHYEEQGTLVQENGARFQASRKYVYRYKDEKISVFFAEEQERLFHHLEFQGNIAVASHLCICDQYDALYEFPDPHTFQITYFVKGPKKDYSIHTIFNRILPEEV